MKSTKLGLCGILITAVLLMGIFSCRNAPPPSIDSNSIVEEKDLRIPNMRGIMMARKKPLQVVPAIDVSANTRTEKFEKPAAKGACKMVDAGDLDQLIDLLHNEAKVI